MVLTGAAVSFDLAGVPSSNLYINVVCQNITFLDRHGFSRDTRSLGAVVLVAAACLLVTNNAFCCLHHPSHVNDMSRR